MAQQPTSCQLHHCLQMLLSLCSLELSEETIDKMNKQAEVLAIAKTITAMEICEGLLRKPMVNNEDRKFLQHLQHYANLEYGLLGNASP
eukprot:5820108-Ditylum_brightwellii.AAC.1